MADDMKRVGLIFDSEGNVDFRKSLTLTNSALQENRNQFKLTKSSWDENTKASKKLKDTQTYLAKQYDDSSQKVRVLRSELNELENAEKRDEIAISKKRSTLANTEVTMGNYKKGLEEVNQKVKAGTADIEEYAKKLSNLGDKSKQVGSDLTKNLTVPIAAIATASIAAWVEIDDAYDGITTATGATGDALADLHNVFDEVFGSMPMEAQAVSDSVGELNTRFGFTGDALTNASRDFLKFASINNTDVKTSVQLVSRAMGDANISSDQYGIVLDALTVAAQNSGIGIDKLTENVTKYGAPMRALGYSTQESIAIFASWEKAGVNTEIAFSGMKKAISNFTADGKDAKVEFKKLVEGVQNGSISSQEAMEVFGAKAGPDLIDAIQGGRFAFDDMLNAVLESGGKMEETYQNTLDPIDKAKISLNNMKSVGAEIGGLILSTLEPAFVALSNALKNFTEWFKGLDDGIKNIIVVIGGLLAAIGPLLVIFGVLASSISSIITLFTSAKVSMAGVQAGSSLVTGGLSSILAPIAAVIAIVALLIATFTDLWNSNEVFKTAMTEAWNSICSTLQNLWDTVLKPIFDILVKVIMNVWENGIQPLWNYWIEFVSTIMIAMAGLWESVKPIVDWFVSFFGPILVGIFDLVGSTIGNVIATIMNIFGSWLTNAGEVISGIIGIIGGIIDFITGVFTGNWRQAWEGVKSIFSGIFEGLMGVVKAPLNGIIGFLNLVIDAINGMISGVNNISFDIPEWLGGGTVGFDLGFIPNLAYLAKGGQLLGGMAMVGEAGPELLMQQGNRTTVAPLSTGGGATPLDIIDYEKLAFVMIRALKTVSINIHDEPLGEFVDARVLKAVM